MADHIDQKSAANDVHVEKAIEHVDDSHNLDEKAQAAEYKMAAIEAENVEHDMGVLDAVKAYPMAATWAFVMSCTIVRQVFSLDAHISSRQITAANMSVDHGGLLCLHHG
jgi:SP family general alpha glucoside:H+ symporter-like MFS transporter